MLEIQYLVRTPSSLNRLSSNFSEDVQEQFSRLPSLDVLCQDLSPGSGETHP